MKLAEFQDQIKAIGLDAALFYSREWDPNIYYFTGYSGSGILVVPSRKDPFLIVPLMEEGKARKTKIQIISKNGLVWDVLKEEWEKKRIDANQVGIDAKSLPFELAGNVKKQAKRLVDCHEISSRLRSLKTKKEIAWLKRGCRLTDSLMQKTWKSWSTFETEADVAAFLEYHAKRKGCPTSFPTIIASGKHAGVPHHETALKKIQRGFCVMDFGIRHKGYCTDISRTIAVGEIPSKLEKMYDRVLGSQLAAIEEIKPDVPCRKLDETARRVLGKNACLFTHGLGHGIGVEIHEPPWVNSRSVDMLESGMCITIEPGIYTNKFGIRIEDDILVTEKGPVMLTKSPKDLVVIS